jgi:hypothetical protein
MFSIEMADKRSGCLRCCGRQQPEGLRPASRPFIEILFQNLKSPWSAGGGAGHNFARPLTYVYAGGFQGPGCRGEQQPGGLRPASCPQGLVVMDTLPRAFAGACKITARPCVLDAKQPRASATGAGATAESRKARLFCQRDLQRKSWGQKMRPNF